jgi:hypothetical protein
MKEWIKYTDVVDGTLSVQYVSYATVNFEYTPYLGYYLHQNLSRQQLIQFHKCVVKLFRNVQICLTNVIVFMSANVTKYL